MNHWAHLFPDWFKAEAGDIAKRLQKKGCALLEDKSVCDKRAAENAVETKTAEAAKAEEKRNAKEARAAKVLAAEVAKIIKNNALREVGYIVETQRAVVLRVLSTSSASSLDVAARTGLSVKTASAVLCELRLDGLIEKCGTDRLEDSGKTVIVYKKVEDKAKCAASA